MKSQKSKKIRKIPIKTIIPYVFSALLILALVFFGSKNKGTSRVESLNMSSLATNNFSVSADQLSEFYVVASLADSMSLNSSEVLSSNYVTVSVMLDAGQSSTDRLEKPTFVDTSDLSRDGIKIHIVSAGETMESISNYYGVNTDQIRWSNDRKDTSVSAGESLYIPGVPGIVYKVKSGENLDGILSKTGANREQTIILNDLEKDSSLTEGQLLVLPGGTLPEEDRPEYVPPAPPTPVIPVYTYTYSYSGSTGSRDNFSYIATGFYVDNPGNPGFPGQCTWYAWYMRSADPRSLGRLPGGLGNANSWAYQLAAAGYRVDNVPEAGAVFQTTSGWYGHVGYVMAVNGDGSILVREMNYNYYTYAVSESVIPANVVPNLNYIH